MHLLCYNVDDHNQENLKMMVSCTDSPRDLLFWYITVHSMIHKTNFMSPEDTTESHLNISVNKNTKAKQTSAAMQEKSAFNNTAANDMFRRKATIRSICSKGLSRIFQPVFNACMQAQRA